jgi:hypothetical protein
MAKRKNDNWKVHEPTIRYFEQNDLSEKLSAVEPVRSSIKISKREFIVSVNNDIAKSVELIAKRKKISSSTLLQRWVNEKVAENSALAR